jgi:hypothetical protein
MKDRSWSEHAATTALAVSMVLCLFAISDSRLGILRSKQSLQYSELGLTSIAPDNLPRAAEIFRTSIPKQDSDFPIERMTSLPAWNTLNSTLSDYAERLKLLDTQRKEIDRAFQKRSSWTSWAALVSIFAALFLLQFSKRTENAKPTEG